MPRFLACSTSYSPITGGGNLCHTFSYGEYDTLEAAMTRLNKIAEIAFQWKDKETIKYYVNELSPPNTYPVVAKSYPLA
jgi:hypothetical protein